MSDLHGQIMNLPCQPREVDAGGDAWMGGYRYGHRDARHAAAELACLAKAADALNTPKPTASADSSAITLARQYLANLPQSPADSHEAIAHLSGVLAALDELEPTAWVVYALFDGAMVPQYPATLDRKSADDHAAMFTPEARAEVQPLYLAPPASSNLLTAARHYASSYLQQERDDPKLCCDAQHHKDVCALFAAIEREGEGGPNDARDGPRYRALIEAAHAYITGKPMTPQQWAVHNALKNLGDEKRISILGSAIDAAIAATKEGA